MPYIVQFSVVERFTFSYKNLTLLSSPTHTSSQEDDEDAGYYDEIMPDGQVKLGKASLEALAADKAKRAKKSGKKGKK